MSSSKNKRYATLADFIKAKGIRIEKQEQKSIADGIISSLAENKGFKTGNLYKITEIGVKNGEGWVLLEHLEKPKLHGGFSLFFPEAFVDKNKLFFISTKWLGKQFGIWADEFCRDKTSVDRFVIQVDGWFLILK